MVHHMKEVGIEYFFAKPGEISSDVFDQICTLIKEGQGVGTSYIGDNLQNAFLIGYVTHKGKVIGTSTHKYPKEEYRKKIEAATGLELSGFLERGYTSVQREYRAQGIGGRLIRGLIERSMGKDIYVTIHLTNIPPLRMTYGEKMVLEGTFTNDRTGHKLGVFTNRRPPERT